MVKPMLKAAYIRGFLAFDRLGLHVLPKHYYSAIPDYTWLRKNRSIWQRRVDIAGVNWCLDEQLNWLLAVCEPYYAEVEGLRAFREIAAMGVGLGYGPIESQVLHCFIRKACPPRVVEIGSGMSTAVMLRAASLNVTEGRRGSNIVSVEPFPNPRFQRLSGLVHIKELCQSAPQQIFDELESGDLLFIDSTHALKTGSELQRIYLEIIPRLKAGVFIHIHDIMLPYLYDRAALTSNFGPQETSLVLALLVNNSSLSVLCCESALHYDRTKELMGILTDYRPQPGSAGLAGDAGGHFPASLWLRTG